MATKTCKIILFGNCFTVSCYTNLDNHSLAVISKKSVRFLEVEHQAWISFLAESRKSHHMKSCVLRCFEKIEFVVIDIFNVMPYSEIDYLGGSILQKMLNIRVICDTVFSYLSTLGGAFSALGDSFSHCADKAGEISVKQFQIALMLGEEPLVARCRLFLGLSLIQKGQLKCAKKLILSQYYFAKKSNDIRLLNMCLGIWAKLKYTRHLRAVKALTNGVKRL